MSCHVTCLHRPQSNNLIREVFNNKIKNYSKINKSTLTKNS